MPDNEKPTTERVVEYVREKAGGISGINWVPVVLAGGAIFLGYELMKSAGLIGPPTSTQVTPACPRGQKYNINVWETCDPNYLEQTNWFGLHTGVCECQSTVSGPTDVMDLARRGMIQSEYQQFPADDKAQLSLENWKPLTRQEKEVFGIYY